MKIFLSVFFAFFIFSLSMSVRAAQKNDISDYHFTFFSAYDQRNTLQIAIRQYKKNNEPYVLLVNPMTLVTSESPMINLRTQNVSALNQTPFLKALNRFTAISNSNQLQNAGATHAIYSIQGFFLTVDLCPTKKPFAKKLFQQLLVMAQQQKRPMPVAIAITGLWIKNHPQEFAWLIQQTKTNKLTITWVNHSYHHPYDPHLPLKQNFLLAPGVNFEQEVLATEQLLLKHGQLPTVFFRFPGLVSNAQQIHDLKKLSLIPIGSDAWLVKNQRPKPGSFILVHGNGNEPEGIALLLPLLRSPQFHWLQLAQAFVFI